MAPVQFLGLLLLLLAVAPLPTTAVICSTDANYAANSTFSTNLNRLLSSLPANGSDTGFFNNTAGSVPDRAYGLVLCRGDVSAGKCRSCLDTAAEDILKACPYRRSAVIWKEECMLRYSNLNFFSVDVPDDDRLKEYTENPNSLTADQVAQFNRQLSALMAGLVRYATSNASALMFGTGDADYGDAATPKLYGLVQCTRDQSAGDCGACLRGIIREIPNRSAGRTGARILTATCNFRYELYRFFDSLSMVSVPLPTNATPPAAAPDQPPSAAGLSPPISSPVTHEGRKKTSTVLIVLAVAGTLGSAAVLIAALCFLCYCWRKPKEGRLRTRETHEISTMESLLFNLSTLRAATACFSDQNKLGQGGFGSVYKGLLPSGQVIAVKRLKAGSGQGVGELKNEVVLLAKLQHRNLVRLLGLCLDGEENLLVYEYVPNGSLDKFLFDPTRSQQLNWEKRRKIIGGVARGLQYLHEDSQVKIIHRDLKASNILLDADMNPKISDFGLARLFGEDQTQASTTRVAGTFGYMAPEYVTRGRFSNKSDVFSFGVLVLEILTGQRNTFFSDSAVSTDLLGHLLYMFSKWACIFPAWRHWRNGTLLEILDPSLGGQQHDQGAGDQVMRCAQIGLLCVQEAAADRPTMATVVLILSSHSVLLQVPSKPAFFAGHSREHVNAQSRRSTGDGDGSSASRPEAPLLPCSPNDVTVSELDPR